MTWLTGLAMGFRHGPFIEIDGLPNLRMEIFHGELLVITRWYVFHIKSSEETRVACGAGDWDETLEI